MKINQEPLSETLSQAINFVSSRPTLPVLSHFLLTVKDDRLTVSATDLEAFIRLTVPCQSGKDDWQTTVPARLFLELVNSLQDEITLRHKVRLSITCGESKSQISTIDALEFPVLPEMPDVEPLVFEIPDLLKCLANTTYAAATDLSRPILSGVNFNSDGEQLVASAADGFRMSVYKMPYQGQEFDVTIPAIFLGKLARILNKKEKGQVKVYTSEAQAFFELDDTLVASQLLPGLFVNVQRIVPAKQEHAITLNAKSLKSALKTLLILAKRQDGFIDAKFTQDAIDFATRADEEGQIDGSVKAAFEGEPYQSALNGLYMRDAITGMDGKICIEQANTTTPLAIYPVGKRDEQIAVIMPMTKRT